MMFRFVCSLLSASLCSRYLEWLSTAKPEQQHFASRHYHVLFKTTTILHSEDHYMVMPEFKSTTVCNSRSSFEACVRPQVMTASYHDRVCALQFFGAFSTKTCRNATISFTMSVSPPIYRSVRTWLENGWTSFHGIWYLGFTFLPTFQAYLPK